MKFPAEDGGKHGAGAQRPKAQLAPIRAIADARGKATPHESAGNCGNKILRAKKLQLKLREQAKKLGLIPGSPRWRAYVLGTIAAQEKRKRLCDKRTPADM